MAWLLEARFFMRRSIEGLDLVPPGIVVEHQDVGTDRILVNGRLASIEAGWLDCGTLSRSCHSRYVRTLADLPICRSAGRWSGDGDLANGAPVSLRLAGLSSHDVQRGCRRPDRQATRSPVGTMRSGCACGRDRPGWKAGFPHDGATGGTVFEGHATTQRSPDGRTPECHATIRRHQRGSPRHRH